MVSQIRSMGLRSGEYGGRYIGSHRCQFVDLRLCHEALSTIKMLRDLWKSINREASSKNAWNVSESEWEASIAKNSPLRGQTMPMTFMRMWSPFFVTRVLLPFRSHRRLGRGSPSKPDSSANQMSMCSSSHSFSSFCKNCSLKTSSWRSGHGCGTFRAKPWRWKNRTTVS